MRHRSAGSRTTKSSLPGRPQHRPRLKNGPGICRSVRHPFEGLPVARRMEIVMRTPTKWSLALGVIMASGLAASGGPPPVAVTRPDLNGTRVRAPGQATVYLIDNGF